MSRFKDAYSENATFVRFFFCNHRDRARYGASLALMKKVVGLVCAGVMGGKTEGVEASEPVGLRFSTFTLCTGFSPTLTILGAGV